MDEAEQQYRTRRMPSRALYDTYSPAVDIASVEEQRMLGYAPTGIAGRGVADAVTHHQRRRHYHDVRQGGSGNIIAWAGAAPGTFSSAEVAADFTTVTGTRGKSHTLPGTPERAGIGSPAHGGAHGRY